MKESDSDKILLVVCSHPDHPGVTHDLSDFAVGAPDERYVRSNNWGGGFRGRPGLLQDLMPVILAKYGAVKPAQFRSHFAASLRAFYRILDTYEDMLKRQNISYQPVERLHHLTSQHLEIMSLPGPNGLWTPLAFTQAAAIRSLILDSVYLHELEDIHLPTLIRPRTRPKEPPTLDEGASLIRFLRGEVLRILTRWRRADRLAEIGRNLLCVPRMSGTRMPTNVAPTEADAHATYRALIARTGDPLPSNTMLRNELGLSDRQQALPRWWPRHIGHTASPGGNAGELVSFADLAAGLYPTSEDIALIALLCLGRSGWNPSTLLSIDIEMWSNQYDEDAMWVFAPKGRSGGAYQYTVARTNDRTGIYALVNTLIERSAPLRKWLIEHRDAHPTPDLGLRSPWLGANDSRAWKLFIADPGDTKAINAHLKNAIKRHNRATMTQIQVRPMTCGDFRDLAATWTYRDSRYSIWVTMLLLGHRHSSTTRAYLTSRAARQESHQLVKSVMDDVLSQICSNRHWDPALTRAAVEGIDVTQEARARLDAYRNHRTYDGSICHDPFHPPRQVDPSHPQDGKARCIQGHRCTASSCPNGMVFSESLPWIARRVAELEWTEQRIGVVRFSTSTDAQDLNALRETLAQWPQTEVEQYINHWRVRIQDGTHRPLRLAGQH